MGFGWSSVACRASAASASERVVVLRRLVCYTMFMATDFTQIQLTDAERRLVYELAERTGKPWTNVLNEALSQYRQKVVAPVLDSSSRDSWHDRLHRHGLVGSLRGGPADLSSNPSHMQGFGLSDH
jgi:hypothetical protein